VEIKAGPAFPKRTKTQDCILARTTIWLNFPKSRRDRWQPPLLGKILWQVLMFPFPG